MKNVLKEKFKNHVLVKPLYKRLKNGNKIKPQIQISVDRVDLDGHGIKVKKHVVRHSIFNSKYTYKNKNIFLCDTCASFNKSNSFEKFRTANAVTHGLKGRKMLHSVTSRGAVDDVDIEDKKNKLVQAGDNIVTLPKVPCSWLRLYPMPLSEESMCSVIIRCTFCQFGLSTFLVLWTTLFIFIIHYFEGPFEIKVYHDFGKQQNQLVIDLATELRQISPLSNRWKAAIEKRIEEATYITSVAVLRGARLRPGQYWSLSGTFLFTIYVMTALGFGAPVPQTTGGRTAVLIYGVFAIPIHFYLMMNASTCLVVHVQDYAKQLKNRLFDKKPFVVGKIALDNESPNCSRHSEVLKTPSRCCLGRSIMRCLSVLSACHSVPLTGVLYYLTGACIFGTLENLEPLEVLVFPLEFTTNGGLDHIPGPIRIVYGFYVEGAMILIACALASFRRYSISTIIWASEKYQLFATVD